MLTPYQFASNRPIDGIDLDGLEWVIYMFSPMQSNKFFNLVQHDGSIYNLRRLVHYAIHNPFENDKIPSLIQGDKKPDNNSAVKYEYYSNFDGVIIVPYQWNDNRSEIEQSSFFYYFPPYDKKTIYPKHDKNYPLDTKPLDKKDFYAKYDVIGEFTFNPKKGTGSGFAYMKIFGRVEFSIKVDNQPIPDVESVRIRGKYIGNDQVNDSDFNFFSGKYIEKNGVLTNGYWEIELYGGGSLIPVVPSQAGEAYDLLRLLNSESEIEFTPKKQNSPSHEKYEIDRLQDIINE